MSNQNAPWDVRDSDFTARSTFARKSEAYRLFFEYLKMSPSYELARLIDDGRVRAQDVGHLPADFASVQKTFDLLGDVRLRVFRDWWLSRGLKAFGFPFSKPKIHPFGAWEDGEIGNSAELVPLLDNYLQEKRVEEGQGPALLLVIPLDSKKAEMLRDVADVFDRLSAIHTRKDKVPQIRLQGKRLRVENLAQGLRLLKCRAENPDIELWRLGAIVGLSDTYSPDLDPKAPRKIRDKVEQGDRELMAKITYRALRKYEWTAENAARGLFPLDARVNALPFDYPKIYKQIQMAERWEEDQRVMLQKIEEIKKAAPSIDSLLDDL